MNDEVVVLAGAVDWSSLYLILYLEDIVLYRQAAVRVTKPYYNYELLNGYQPLTKGGWI